MAPRPVALDVAALARDYRAGADIRKLAARYYAGYGTVRLRLLDAGVRLRPAGGRRGKPQRGI